MVLNFSILSQCFIVEEFSGTRSVFFISASFLVCFHQNKIRIALFKIPSNIMILLCILLRSTMEERESNSVGNKAMGRRPWGHQGLLTSVTFYVLAFVRFMIMITRARYHV